MYLFLVFQIPRFSHAKPCRSMLKLYPKVISKPNTCKTCKHAPVSLNVSLFKCPCLRACSIILKSHSSKKEK